VLRPVDPSRIAVCRVAPDIGNLETFDSRYLRPSMRSNATQGARKAGRAFNFRSACSAAATLSRADRVSCTRARQRGAGWCRCWLWRPLPVGWFIVRSGIHVINDGRIVG
jgi:hypothetical protein